MKRCVSLGILIGVMGLCLLSVGFAQAGKFSLDLDNTPLSRFLDTLKRFDPNFQFGIAPELADTKVSASLVEVTVDEALSIVLGQAGLMSVKDAGVYQIRPKPEAKGPRGDRPTLPAGPLTFISRPATVSAAGADAGAGAAPGAGATAAPDAAKANPPLRLIFPRFADPYDMAMLFGGNYVEGGGLYGSSGSNGGGSGGGGYNSSGGSSGSSSRGSTGSSGSSSRSSSRGSTGGY